MDLKISEGTGINLPILNFRKRNKSTTDEVVSVRTNIRDPETMTGIEGASQDENQHGSTMEMQGAGTLIEMVAGARNEEDTAETMSGAENGSGMQIATGVETTIKAETGALLITESGSEADPMETLTNEGDEGSIEGMTKAVTMIGTGRKTENEVRMTEDTKTKDHSKGDVDTLLNKICF